MVIRNIAQLVFWNSALLVLSYILHMPKIRTSRRQNSNQ